MQSSSSLLRLVATIIFSPLNNIPSISFISSLKFQYGLASSYFVSGHPMIVTLPRCWSSMSEAVTSLNFSNLDFASGTGFTKQ